jgi:hypothetical protein
LRELRRGELGKNSLVPICTKFICTAVSSPTITGGSLPGNNAYIKVKRLVCRLPIVSVNFEAKRNFCAAQEAAVVFFVKKGAPRTSIPQEMDGVRTRIVGREILPQQGMLTAEQSAALEQAGTTTPSTYSISEAEFARAKAVHSARVDQMDEQSWGSGPRHWSERRRARRGGADHLFDTRGSTGVYPRDDRWSANTGAGIQRVCGGNERPPCACRLFAPHSDQSPKKPSIVWSPAREPGQCGMLPVYSNYRVFCHIEKAS